MIELTHHNAAPGDTPPDLLLDHDLTPEVLATIRPIFEYLKTASRWELSEGLDPIQNPKDLDYPSEFDVAKDTYNKMRYSSDNPGPEPTRVEFANDDPNLGWKLHLNVRPEDVTLVNFELENNGYNYKYMTGRFNGARTKDGRIFTVYTGSYRNSLQSARDLSEQFDGILKYPAAAGDVEFARGVVGRFCCHKYTLEPLEMYGDLGIQYPFVDAHRLTSAGIQGPYQDEVRDKLVLQALRIITTSPMPGYEDLDFGGDYFLPLEALDQLHSDGNTQG